MSKKIWYSVPLSLYWNEIYPTQKKITPNFTDEQIFHVLRVHNLKLKSKNNESDYAENFVTGLEMWWEDCNKNLLHLFFIEKNLQKFLEDLPLADLKGIKKYLYDNGSHKNVLYVKNRTSTNCVTYYYGIHIPYETDGFAFQFNIYEDERMELFYLHGKHFGGITDKMYFDLLKNDDKKSIILTNCFRLAVNTIAYMKCFPECVVDGVPRITVDRNENRTDKNVMINITDKISDTEVSSKKITPHFRKGYFKLLRSDFYTKKKGELIFVRETMVNGKAKTVYTVDNIEKVISLDD